MREADTRLAQDIVLADDIREKNFHPLEKTAFRLVPLGGQVRQGNRDRPLYTPHQGNQTPYSDREKGKSADEQCCHYKLLDDEIREEYHDVLPDDERGLPLFRFSGNGFKQIAHDAVIAFGKNGGVPVLIDCHDDLCGLDARVVLHRA